MIYIEGYKNTNPKYFPMKNYRVRYHVIEDVDVWASSKREAISSVSHKDQVSRRIKKVTVTRMIDEIDRL